MVFTGRSKRKTLEAAAHHLYGAVVQHARRPEFYTVGGVPDSVDGRFDMIALHAALVLRRLRDRLPTGGLLMRKSPPPIPIVLLAVLLTLTPPLDAAAQQAPGMASGPAAQPAAPAAPADTKKSDDAS